MSEEHKARTKEMIKVMQAYVDGHEIEVTHSGGNSWELMNVEPPSWSWFHMEYRIAKTPDSIDWSHVAPEWKYMARDEEGDVWFYELYPTAYDDHWSGEATRASSHASYKRGTVDWKDSLVKRPD